MPVVIMEDESTHSIEQPECAEPSCICHEEEALRLAWAELQAVLSYVERDLSAEEE